MRMQAQVAAGEERAGGQDAAKAARLLSEIAAVAEEADLSSIAVVDADAAFLQATAEQVCAQSAVGGVLAST